MSEASQPNDVVTMDKVVSLCRRRGFVFPSSEIYGGLGSSYDYGHYGVLAKNNVKARWMEAMTQERDDIVALDSTIILHPKVWEASGHLQSFSDPLIDCRYCKKRFRADDLEHCECGKKPSKHPGEASDCDLTEPRQFNLMFETTIGPVQESGSKVYLRPETAQGIFINFKNVLQLARRKPPFGIAQIGKSFRNEITPGNFLFRTREFEQMELEFFVPPEESERWYEYWLEERMGWYRRYGLRENHLRLRPHSDDEALAEGELGVHATRPIRATALEMDPPDTLGQERMPDRSRRGSTGVLGVVAGLGDGEYPAGEQDGMALRGHHLNGREPPFGSLCSARSSEARRWISSSASSLRMRRLAAASSSRSTDVKPGTRPRSI